MAVMSPPRVAPAAPPLPDLPPGDWPEQGKWTYEDYLRLPDVPGRRYEILFGVLHMSSAPDLSHQRAVSAIDRRLGVFIEDNNLGSLDIAPFGVRLSGVADPVQPDAFFVRQDRQEILKPQYCEGPPDLVIEVLSPSTTRTDRREKFDAYEQAGVTEYWIANPKLRTVEVYALEEGRYALVEQHRAEERIVSRVLPALELEAGALFGAD